MARIAVLIEDYFEDVEYSEPAKRFRAEGHELVHLGLKRGARVTGKQKETWVTIDARIRDASPESFDAMFLPGGYSPDRLRGHEEAVKFVRDFVRSGKPVLMICHGPQLLITADVVRGRRMTGWKSIRQDLINAGADYRDEAVVTDGNFVSSRSPEDIPDFIRESLTALRLRVHA